MLFLIPQERLMRISLFPVFFCAGNNLCPFYLSIKSVLFSINARLIFSLLEYLKMLLFFLRKALLLTSLMTRWFLSLVSLLSFLPTCTMDIFESPDILLRKFLSMGCYGLMFLSMVCFLSQIWTLFYLLSRHFSWILALNICTVSFLSLSSSETCILHRFRLSCLLPTFNIWHFLSTILLSFLFPLLNFFFT